MAEKNWTYDELDELVDKLFTTPVYNPPVLHGEVPPPAPQQPNPETPPYVCVEDYSQARAEARQNEINAIYAASVERGKASTTFGLFVVFVLVLLGLAGWMIAYGG